MLSPVCSMIESKHADTQSTLIYSFLVRWGPPSSLSERHRSGVYKYPIAVFSSHKQFFNDPSDAHALVSNHHPRTNDTS